MHYAVRKRLETSRGKLLEQWYVISCHEKVSKQGWRVQRRSGESASAMPVFGRGARDRLIVTDPLFYQRQKVFLGEMDYL